MNNKRRYKWTRMVFIILAGAVLAGCDGPSRPVPFYEMSVPRQKLRTIKTLDLKPSASEPNIPPVSTLQAPEQMELTLEQCRAWAIENNLKLKAELISPTIAAQDVSFEEAKFEASFSTSISYAKTDSPTVTSSLVEGSKVEDARVNTGIKIPLQTGGEINLGLFDQRQKTNQGVTLNPFYASSLGFSISQPLLQNAGKRANTHSIRIARYNQKIRENRTKLEVITVLAAVDRAYWRLAAARKELEVRIQQYELSKAQLERARRFVDSGERAEVEVLRAQTGIAAQSEAIITAENNLRDRQRELKKIIQLSRVPVKSGTRLVPLTEPDLVYYDLRPEILAKQAIENRTELLELELQIAKEVSSIDFYKNQALPLVTMDYSYNMSGLGPTRSSSYDMLGRNNFANQTLGLNLIVPLGNERAKSTLRKTFYQRMQYLSNKQNQKALIELEVLNAIDQLEANWQRILAARQNVLLEARLTKAEIRQFEIGMRTSTDVLEAQARLADAQRAEILALTEYQIAQVDLAFATGTLLGAAKVDWQPAPPL